MMLLVVRAGTWGL